MQNVDVFLSICVLYITIRTFIFLLSRRQFSQALFWVTLMSFMLTGPTEDWIVQRDTMTNCVVDLNLFSCRVSYCGVFGLFLLIMGMSLKEFKFPRNTVLCLDRNEFETDMSCTMFSSMQGRDDSLKRYINCFCYYIPCCRCTNPLLILKFFSVFFCLLFLSLHGISDKDFVFSLYWGFLSVPFFLTIKQHYTKAMPWMLLILFVIFSFSSTYAEFNSLTATDEAFGWQFYVIFFVLPVFYTVIVVLADGDKFTDPYYGVEGKCERHAVRSIMFVLEIIIFGWENPFRDDQYNKLPNGLSLHRTSSHERIQQMVHSFRSKGEGDEGKELEKIALDHFDSGDDIEEMKAG